MAQVTVPQIVPEGYAEFAQRHLLSGYVRQAAWALLVCRTAVLDGYIQACPEGHVECVWYNSCVGRWLDEFWNDGNVAIVDELGAPAVLVYYPLTGTLRCRESLKQMIRQFRTAFHDLFFSLTEDFIAEGDKVVARCKGVATQKGAFGSIPMTGESATWTGVSIFRIVEGKVAEEIGEEALGVLQQLGVVPLLGQGSR